MNPTIWAIPAAEMLVMDAKPAGISENFVPDRSMSPGRRIPAQLV